MSSSPAPGTSSNVPNALFKDVKYYIIGSVDSKINELLNKGGGKQELYLTEMVTHAIADDDTEDAYSEAKDLFEIPVVTSNWVLLSLKINYLLPTTGFSPDSSQVFHGMVACSSELSAEDNNVIWALIYFHGGRCVAALTQEVTHLIISGTSGSKYAEAIKHEDIHIVTPDWVVDCVAEKEHLSELRYHPRLLMTEDEIIESTKIKEEEKLDLDPYGLPMSPPVPDQVTPNLLLKSDSTRTKEALARMVSSRMTSTNVRPVLDPSLLMKNRMDFAPSLEMSPSPPLPVQSPSPPPNVNPLVPTIPGFPGPRPLGLPRGPSSPRGGGSPRGPRSPRVRGTGSTRGQLKNITNNAEGRPARGRGRGRGSRGGAVKMTHLMTNMSRPPQQYYMGPLPPHMQYGPMGIPTPTTMAVYYGHDPSEHIPEALCMLGCVFYVTDYHKYLDSNEIDNWKQVIEQHGGQVDDSYSNRVTHVLCEHQKSDVFQLALRDGKRVVTAHWLNDCLIKKKMQHPWLVLHFPSPYGIDRPCKNQIITVTNFEGDERLRVKHMISVTGAKYTGYLTRNNSVVVAKRPEGEKYRKAVEWHIPVVNVQWLNNLLLGDMMALKLPIHVKYQHFADEDSFRIAEQWRVGHMLEGWKLPIKVSKETWKRFGSSAFLKPANPIQVSNPMEMISDPSNPVGQKRKAEDVENEGIPPEKRARNDDVRGEILEEQHLNGAEAPVVLLTGIGKRRTEILIKNVRKLGGVVTSQPDKCSHLVVTCIARTMNFFLAFSRCKYLVTPDWITQSAKAGKFLDEADFLLKDEKAESLFNFNLQESLRRIREKKIFQELSFHITPSVKPSKQSLSGILESCCSHLLDQRPTLREICTSKTTQGKPAIIIITCENDLHILQDLKRRNISVHNAEFILTGLIRQEVDYNAYKYDF